MTGMAWIGEHGPELLRLPGRRPSDPAAELLRARDAGGQAVTSVYGRIVTGSDVRAAAQATLELWLPTYVAEIQRQKNLTLPPVRHYSTGIDPATPADHLPGVVLVAPGISSEPERRGAGLYDAWWALGVGVVVAHRERDTACLWAEAYTGALKACLVQQKSLGGFAADLEWVDEEVTQADWSTEFSVWAGALEFTVLVPAVLDASAGLASPPAPDATVPMQTVTVSSTHITTSPTP